MGEAEEGPEWQLIRKLRFDICLQETVEAGLWLTVKAVPRWDAASPAIYMGRIVASDWGSPIGFCAARTAIRHIGGSVVLS
jgi:hypothetical protein